MSRCVKDYPEHLNPFDDNYSGVPELEVQNTGKSKKKYNTWSAHRGNQVGNTVAKPRPSFLEKPWAALNITPKGKLGRRLSIIKTTVEKFAVKQKLLSRSNSCNDSRGVPPRSNSVHNDFSFRIVSPKVKEKLRQQAFSPNINKLEIVEPEPVETPATPELNGRLSEPEGQTPNVEHLRVESKKEIGDQTCVPVEAKFNTLGARPKTRKKRPPPPPPTRAQEPASLQSTNGHSKSEDCQSANSSITQDLERYVSSEEESSSSLAEAERTTTK